MYPRGMCIPAHISLVICVPLVTPGRDTKNIEALYPGLQSLEVEATRDRFLKFQPIQNINGRRLQLNNKVRGVVILPKPLK